MLPVISLLCWTALCIVDRPYCSDFPNWTFCRRTQTEMQHLCITFLTTAEGRGWTERRRGEKTRRIGTYIHEIISNSDLPRPIQGHYRIQGHEHPVLTLFKTTADWLRIRVICQHYFQTHSPARITTKLGFPLEIRRRKSTQITQYNLYA